jgi:hypothetical protein
MSSWLSTRIHRFVLLASVSRTTATGSIRRSAITLLCGLSAFRSPTLWVLFFVQVSVILEPEWDLHFFHAPQRRSFPARPDEGDATFYWAALPGAARHPRWSYNTVAERDQLGEELRGQLRVELIPSVRRLLDRHIACEEARQDPQLPGHLASERIYRALLTDAGPSSELDEELVAAQRRDSDADRKFIQWAQMRLLDGPTWRSLEPD